MLHGVSDFTRAIGSTGARSDLEPRLSISMLSLKEIAYSVPDPRAYEHGLQKTIHAPTASPGAVGRATNKPVSTDFSAADCEAKTLSLIP